MLWALKGGVDTWLCGSCEDFGPELLQLGPESGQAPLEAETSSAAVGRDWAVPARTKCPSAEEQVMSSPAGSPHSSGANPGPQAQIAEVIFGQILQQMQAGMGQMAQDAKRRFELREVAIREQAGQPLRPKSKPWSLWQRNPMWWMSRALVSPKA